MVTAKAEQVSASSTPITVKYLSLSGATLAQLSAGQSGSGVLAYYVNETDQEGAPPLGRPNLTVLLTKTPGARTSMAEIWDTSAGKGYVSITRQKSGHLVLNAPAVPTIMMTAIGGWWVRNGIPNYNLHIEITGQVCAMWGAGPDCGANPGYLGALTQGQSNFIIETRDPQRVGIPEWDLRTLVPPMPGSGVVRSSYAQRECASPFKRLPSPAPAWPYVVAQGTFLQSPGTFQPPIVVDWTQSRIVDFAELVTVRGQNCSYAFYSLTPITPGKLNTPDFEAPFAFYDLSHQGKGEPNLIIRSGHYYAGDPWLASELPPNQRSGAPPLENIRYSWKQGVGDGKFDYKVDLFGTIPYNDHTEIAGDSAAVNAPAYDQLPQWVVDHSWPAATFIDTEGHSYATSEGLYDWPAQAPGLPYLLGLSDTPETSAFTPLPLGFRGEVNFDLHQRPFLYFSPVDGQLHLLGATQGTYQVNQTQHVEYRSLSGGDHIDDWKLFNGSKLIGELVQVPGGLIYSANGRVSFLKANIPTEKFRALPPTDHASWVKLGQQLDANKRAFTADDLAAMFSQFSGLRTTIHVAIMSDFRMTASGYHFELYLQPHYDLGGLAINGVTRTGSYAVSFTARTHEFNAAPLTSPDPVLTMTSFSANARALTPVGLRLNLQNPGTADAPLASLIVTVQHEGSQPQLIAQQLLSLNGGSQKTVVASWTPTAAGNWIVNAKLYLPRGKVVDHTTRFNATTPSAPGWRTVITAAWPAMPAWGYLLALVGLASLGVAGGALLVGHGQDSIR